ncbi:SGNH/GDSL hydrolase family protein [Neobacillus drentensis]|uniref:SGNH/GDSL hydrolase family protein n=1 Tax=Neobacillus drentensis TaxID=220684 RepID=UPI001F17DD91|nr:SGNH/GDSL hydrolase family protein [Neobacillus drentensis]ULT56788.1 SGNH/GDSL hydrolase family protein [Neobacillus drentensis]
MKTFFTILLGIACLTVLVWGHSNWNKKIAVASNRTSTSSSIDGDNSQEITTNSSQEDLLAYTSNWPPAAVETFKKAIKEKKTYKILFFGSPAIGSDTSGSYPKVKEKLLETFGNKNIKVGLKTFNTTSTKFISMNNQEEIAAEKADLIVLEPFILLNNGEVLPDNTLTDITKMMNDIKAKNPDTTFILQPSYPLYQAKIYPSQVAVLKKFAEENKIAYLDHWTAWPNSNTEAFKEYLLPDGSAPSEKGYQVWSNYLIKYFTNQ